MPGRGPDRQDCLAARLTRRFGDVRVVHRLDMATSGLIVFARGAEAQRTLSRAFAERAVEKRYMAVVDGAVADDAGTIELPLLADWPNRPRQKIDLVAGKPSTTHYRVVSRVAGRSNAAATTRLELRPVTGRAHQLRVHLHAIGHSILGDALYAPAPVRDAAERLLLHATQLRFAQPRDGTPVVAHSAVPF